MLLSEEPDAIDHLLSSRTGSLESTVETGILFLEELDALGRHNALNSGDFQALESSFCLEGAAPKRSELVAQMLDQLLQLREGGPLRSYAV